MEKYGKTLFILSATVWGCVFSPIYAEMYAYRGAYGSFVILNILFSLGAMGTFSFKPSSGVRGLFRSVGFTLIVCIVILIVLGVHQAKYYS